MRALLFLLLHLGLRPMNLRTSRPELAACNMQTHIRTHARTRTRQPSRDKVAHTIWLVYLCVCVCACARGLIFKCEATKCAIYIGERSTAHARPMRCLYGVLSRPSATLRAIWRTLNLFGFFSVCSFGAIGRKGSRVFERRDHRNGDVQKSTG